MPVEIIAHRGASIECQENTLEAFRVAMEIGADYFECDVHLSKDGVPVVIHDEMVKGMKVSELTKDELKKYDVPELIEVLALGLPVMVEIKSPEEELLKTVVALVNEKIIKLGSLDAKIMGMIEKEAEGLEHIEIVESMDDITGHTDHVAINVIGLTKAYVEQLKENHHKIWVWTVNDVEKAKELIDWGVDGLITDDPRKMKLKL